MQKSILAFLISGVIAIYTATIPLQLQADSRDHRRDNDRDYKHDRKSYKRRDYDRDYTSRHPSDYRRDYRGREKAHTMKSPIIHHGHSNRIPANRIWRHRDIVVVRPYGPLYSGYGFYYRDDDAYKWLAFTAIAVKLLDNLNEQQEREHEAAQIRATTAPIGETITWKEGNASGYVVPTREGTSSAGRYCREFQHEVTIGGASEQSYGTACRQPDGSWEVISTGQ